MLPEVASGNYNWLCTGNEVFPAMLQAIEDAKESIRLETYTLKASELAERFRDALATAAARGVSVKVLLDAFGSMTLPADYLEPVIASGGVVRLFNPLRIHRFGIRNHRKSLVCDGLTAFIGGYNIAPEYDGDGVTCGWCDVGLKVCGPVARQLSGVFDEMFERAEFRNKPFTRLRRSIEKRTLTGENEQLLLSGPGRGRSPITAALRKDLQTARDVRIMVAYFLPTWRLRHDLAQVVRRGGRVQLLLAGKTDVLVSKLAAQSLYRRLLRSGLEIYEYQPQVLHAKMIVIDDVVYVGSANLDQRSLNINYELMVRFQTHGIAEQAREVFERTRGHSERITREGWRRGRSLWRKFKQHWAYFLLVRVDPVIAHRQWRTLPG